MMTAIVAHERHNTHEGARAGIRRIVAEVCAKYDLSLQEILGLRRSRTVAWPRQEVMWRAKRETTASLPMIGLMLGGRDHTTIIHGIRRHEERMKAEAAHGS